MNTRFSDLSGAYQLHYYFCSHTRWNKPVLTEEIRKQFRYNLTYHIVLATQNRKPIFDVDSGKVLVAKWLEVTRAQNVIISRLKLMPDHVHLLVHLIPTTSVLAYVEMLLNCSFELMNEQFGGVLKLHETWDVWEHSFYAGTLGTVTTAQVDRFLAERMK